MSRSQARTKIVLIGGYIIVSALSILGGYWTYARGTCPRFTLTVLYSITVLVFVGLSALTATQSVYKLSVPGYVGRLIAIPLVIISLTALAATFIAPLPQAQALWCDCPAQQAGQLLADGSYAAAEELARRCVNRVDDEACRCECTEVLAEALYDSAGSTMPQPVANVEECRLCPAAIASLNEAAELAQTCNIEDRLMVAVADRQTLLRTYCLACTPTPSPTPTTPPPPTPTPSPSPTPRATQLDIFRVTTMQPSGSRVSVDFRVYRGNQNLSGISEQEFTLLVGNSVETEAASFAERTTDDPVCMIVAVDNSGSIAEGVDGIHEAIEGLNEVRKPNDELGLLIFDEEIVVVVGPSTTDLPTNGIDASGARTAVWSAVEKGLELTSSCSPSISLRYLLLLSDGFDTTGRDGSDVPLLAQQAQQKGVGICAVGLPSDVLQQDLLDEVSSGCGYTPAEDYDGLQGQFVRIFGNIRDFYRFTLPAETVGEGETITVRLEPDGLEDSYGYQP